MHKKGPESKRIKVYQHCQAADRRSEGEQKARKNAFCGKSFFVQFRILSVVPLLGTPRHAVSTNPHLQNHTQPHFFSLGLKFLRITSKEPQASFWPYSLKISVFHAKNFRLNPHPELRHWEGWQSETSSTTAVTTPAGAQRVAHSIPHNGSWQRVRV